MTTYVVLWRIAGPLHGIPYGLKDIFAVPGYKTTWGSCSYEDQVIEKDSWVYQKLVQVMLHSFVSHYKTSKAFTSNQELISCLVSTKREVCT